MSDILLWNRAEGKEAALTKDQNLTGKKEIPSIRSSGFPIAGEKDRQRKG